MRDIDELAKSPNCHPEFTEGWFIMVRRVHHDSLRPSKNGPSRHSNASPRENRGVIYNGLKTLDSPVSGMGRAQVKHGMTTRRFNHKFKGLAIYT